MNFNKQQRCQKKQYAQHQLQTDRSQQKQLIEKQSEIFSFYKENCDPNNFSYSSIIKEIQEIEKMYQEKLDYLKKLNIKLLQTVEYMEKTIEQQKQMLQEKQTIIQKQQIEIQQYRQILQQNTQINIKNLKTEIDDEKIKTERLRNELQNFKQKVEKEKPIIQLFKKIEQTQEEYNQQNKNFMKEVIQLLDKPRSQSFYRQNSKQILKRSSFYE